MNRLLVFTETYARGGGNRYMVDLTNALAPAFDETVLATNPGGLFDEDVARLEKAYSGRTIAVITRARLARNIVRWHPLLRKVILAVLIMLEPVFMLVNIGCFVRLLRQVQPRYVLSCNGGYPAAEATLALVVAARISRLPIVLSIVSMPTARRWYGWPYDWLVDRLVWHCSDAVIVNAELLAKALVELRGADASKLKVLHNGIDDEPLRPRLEQPGEIVLGCVARLERMKGVEVLLDAFTVLALRYPQLRLVFVGQGDLDDEMRSRTAERGLSDRVDYLGHYSGDIAALLAGFDLFVFPSLWEGFPYSIVEAMRSAMPIVSTNVGGIPEAIQTERDGLLVEPSSADSLVGAIIRLIESPELRHNLGRAARLRFNQEFSLQQMHKRARELLATSIGPVVA